MTIQFFMTGLEQDALKNFHPKLHEALKDKLAIFDPAKHEQLRDDLNERLGEIVRGYRVEEGPEVSRIRSIDQRPIALYVDSAHNLTEVYDSGEPSVVAQKWMEHRRVCTRALLDCLSGEAH